MTPLIFPTKDNLAAVFPGASFAPPAHARIPISNRHCVEGEDRLSYTTIIWLFEAFREIVFDNAFRNLDVRIDTITRDLHCSFYRPITTPGVLDVRVHSPAFTERSIALTFSVHQANAARALLSCSQFQYSAENDISASQRVFSDLNRILRNGAGHD